MCPPCVRRKPVQRSPCLYAWGVSSLIAISEICEHEVYEFEYFQTCQQAINGIKLNGSLNSREKGKELLKEYIRANTYDSNDNLHVLPFEKKEIRAK